MIMNTGKRHRVRPLPSMPEITLVPLIDTALTLLIIFMVTTPMVHNAIKVNLPRGRIKEDGGSTQDMVVYVDKDERVYLNGAPVANGALMTQLRHMVASGRDKTVYINADRSVHYGFVTEIVDQMKCIEGIAHVALATKPA